MDDQAHAEHLADLADLLRPAAIRTAAMLGVADHIAAGVTDTERLAQACGTRADVLDSLLRYLVQLELLDRGEGGGYVLPEAAQPLREDHPYSLRETLRMDGVTGRSDVALMGLAHTIRTGEPAHIGSSAAVTGTASTRTQPTPRPSPVPPRDNSSSTRS